MATFYILQLQSQGSEVAVCSFLALAQPLVPSCDLLPCVACGPMAVQHLSALWSAALLKEEVRFHMDLALNCGVLSSPFQFFVGWYREIVLLVFLVHFWRRDDS